MTHSDPNVQPHHGVIGGDDSAAVESGDKKDKPVHGLMARFDDVDSLMKACRTVRDAGYKKTDAYTPFPVHGIDSALGIKPTILPWIVLVCGITGTATALAMQWFMNTYDYPYIISGKPYFSLPAFIPVAFELTILFSAFGTFFGMWALNKLPKFSNPVFTDPEFDRATDDRFFLYVDAKDDRYNYDQVNSMLTDAGPVAIHPVLEDDSPSQVPRFIFTTWMLVIGLSAIPVLVALKMRLTRSPSPRFHVFFDMDFSPAKEAQQNTTLFADSRTMRPDVPGTVYRGQVGLDMLTGVDMQKLAMSDPARAARLVSAYQDAGAEPATAGESNTNDDSPTDESQQSDGITGKAVNTTEESDGTDKTTMVDDDTKLKPAQEANISGGDESGPAEENQQTGKEDPKSIMDTTPWLTEIPMEVDEKLVYQGQKTFNIYCSVCHGRNGAGNGLINQRAQKVLATNWIPPSSLHNADLYTDKYADGKLFSTITNGIRKMPGYGSQIKVEDRWAVVAYVRALQESRQGTIDEVPQDQRKMISAEKIKIEKKIEEAAKQAAEEQAKQK